MNKIAFIGLGNMGGAIASGFINSGAVPAANIFGYDAYAEGLKAFCARTGVTPCGSAEEAIAQADTVLIAVKPYVIEGVLKKDTANTYFQERRRRIRTFILVLLTMYIIRRIMSI